jgi:molybdate transport system ATP-binding protein
MKLAVDIDLALGSGARRFELHARFESHFDRVVLFGPSGVGKSVTLQAIAGLIAPQRGRIVLGERVLFDSALGIDVPARERGLGYLFQEHALFPHMNVARNIAFGLTPTLPRRLDAATLARVEQVMQALDIAGLGARMPQALSGGQRQRVALARALVREPALLLLDEPFAALDSPLRARVRRELGEIRARFGVPMVLISHDPEDVAQFADTLVVCEPGRGTRVWHRGAVGETPLEEIARASWVGV